MNFSAKSKEHMDSCRFCWMCRHICPIGNATGQERNTARARGMILALVAREGVEYSEDIVNNIYECALCGACVKECVTGWDPVMFTKEARLAAALEGKLPAYIEKMIDTLEKTGNIYGLEIDGELKKTIDSLDSSDTLLFLGADARYKTPAKAVKAIELLKKAGVDFTVLADEPDSGYAMDFMVGAAAETKQIMEKAAKQLDYKKIICYDPADAKVFMREYKEWGIELNAEVVTFTSFLSELIKGGIIKLKKSEKAFTFQDPAALARDLEESEPAREILGACGELREMLLNRKDTMLGGNLIMNEYMPEVMKKTAENRWRDALNMGAETVVTASPAEYAVMSEVKPENADLITIEEAVLQCL